METGLFRIDNRYDREIHLTGSGQKYAMVRKALLRNRDSCRLRNRIGKPD